MEHKGEVRWTSPSNIALIKYWGKHGRQLPRNASISFTLSNCISDTTVYYQIGREISGPKIDFYFEEKENQQFGSRIEDFLNSITDHLPWLNQAHLTISSKNSFPHSSGIASSASAMSALAVCLVDIKSTIEGGSSLDMTLASELARLGSGSASRSTLPQLGQWGKCHIEGSTDQYAIPYGEAVDPIFQTYHDDICIVSAEEKSVSSSAGHGLMDKSVFAQQRYQQANERLNTLVAAMKQGDLETFGNIVEDEALTLHGLMLCSEPSFILMEPNTISIINSIRTFRSHSGVPVYFTLDAGPNIHMLYPHAFAEEVDAWSEQVIKPLCHEGRIIKDIVGNGPKKLK